MGKQVKDQQQTLIRQTAARATASTSNGTDARRVVVEQPSTSRNPPQPSALQNQDEDEILPAAQLEEAEEDGQATPTETEQSRLREYSSSSNGPPCFDDVQTIIGKSGRWQLRVFMFASYSGFCTSLHNFIYGFIGVAPNRWCNFPKTPINSTILEQITPRLEAKDDNLNCTYYPWNMANNTLTIDNSSTLACENFEFDHSEFNSTVASEWNLVCSQAAFVVYIQMTYMAGLLIGAPIFGAVSDRMGRKHAILVATVIFTLMGPLIGLAPNFIVFLILRFILACALPGVYACSYVLAIEVVPERWRSTAGNFFNIPFATGYTLLPIVAYYVRNWRNLQMFVSAPAALLIFSWAMLPESPRWLIRKGRLAEAEKILRKAAEYNNSTANIPDDFSLLIRAIHSLERTPKEKTTYWQGFKNGLNEYFQLVKSTKMRNMFLTLCYCWFIIGMNYYGLGLNAENVGADRYTYMLISGVLEFPGYMMVPLFVKHFGRKYVFIGFMWTCALALLVSLFLPAGSIAIVLLSFLGKLFIGANYSLVYLYSSELLPTLVRNCALGVCSMMGRLGSTIAPLIVDVLGRHHPMYPILIFACLAGLAGAMCLILPETKDRGLPETIHEVEMGKVRNARGNPDGNDVDNADVNADANPVDNADANAVDNADANAADNADANAADNADANAADNADANAADNADANAADNADANAADNADANAADNADANAADNAAAPVEDASPNENIPKRVQRKSMRAR